MVFVRENPIVRNAWWLGVPLWLRKPPFQIGYAQRIKGGNEKSLNYRWRFSLLGQSWNSMLHFSASHVWYYIGYHIFIPILSHQYPSVPLIFRDLTRWCPPSYNLVYNPHYLSLYLLYPILIGFIHQLNANELGHHLVWFMNIIPTCEAMYMSYHIFIPILSHQKPHS